jgi:HEAT repeat protein
MQVVLTKLERTAEPRLQGYLCVALGLLGDARATKPLKTVLADARFRPELLKSAAIGLAMLEDRTLVPTLVETLSTATSLASQGAAASVIGWIGDRRAVDPLLKLLGNKDVTASARGYAAVALGRVCDRDRLPWNAVVAEDVHYRAATVTLVAGDGTGVLEIY